MPDQYAGRTANPKTILVVDSNTHLKKQLEQQGEYRQSTGSFNLSNNKCDFNGRTLTIVRIDDFRCASTRSTACHKRVLINLEGSCVKLL